MLYGVALGDTLLLVSGVCHAHQARVPDEFVLAVHGYCPLFTAPLLGDMDVLVMHPAVELVIDAAVRWLSPPLT